MKTTESTQPESEPTRIEGYINQLGALHSGRTIIVTMQEYEQYSRDPSINIWLMCTQHGEDYYIHCHYFGH